MKEKEMDKVTAFDTLFTNNRIQMYKILLSYLQPAVQQKFAIYIKLMELQYTISFFQNHPLAIIKELPHESSISTSHFIDEIMPFCDKSQRAHMSHIKDMLQNFENMKEMMETIQMMKELFPEGTGNSDGSNNGNGIGNLFGNSFDMSQLFNMLGSRDMSGMFDMFGDSFPSSNENKSKS